MMKKLLFFALTVAVFQSAVSQNNFNQVNFYPPSSASMMKYIDYPVSPRTGIPEISIPLFSIRSGKLELPLNLSFHIDDYARVNQQPGAAGAGWSLSSDIQVSRSINGLDDFDGCGYIRTGVYWPDYDGQNLFRDHNYLYAMYNKSKDEEPDKFYYKLLGKGGSFYFMRQQNGTVVPKQVPMTGVQVTYLSGNSSVFKAVDTDGTVYLFSSSIKDQCSPNARQTFDMSWKCTHIISASGADTISFSYVNYNKSVKKCDGKEEIYDQIHITDHGAPSAVHNAVRGPKHVVYGAETTSCTEYIAKIDQENGDFSYVWQNAGSVQDMRSNQNLIIHNLSSIRFKNGRVEFVYDKNEVLIQIKLFAKNQTEPIRIITLNQEGNGYARTLKSLTVGKDIYSFAYKTKHEGEHFPDFWGYGSTGTYMYGYASVPYQSIPIDSGPSGRFADNTFFIESNFYMNVGTQSIGSNYSGSELPYLTIKYPTGGLTTFCCEPHSYRCLKGSNYNRQIQTSGWRIKHIDYFDMDSTLIKQKIYKYGPNEDRCGIIRHEPLFDLEESNCYTDQKVVYYYSLTTDSYEDGATARLRTYLPNTIFQMNYSDGSCVNYNEVAEYNKDMGVETGKIVYKYNLDNLHAMWWQYAAPDSPYPIEDDAWWIGVPDSTIYYKYNNGKYDWVKKVGYRYECHMEPERIFQGRVWQKTIPVLVSGYQSSSFIHDYSQFNYRSSAIKIGCVRLTQEEESIRNDDGSIQTTQTRLYYDNPNHYLPGRKVTTYPTGDVVTEQSLFLEDYLQDSYTQSLQMRNLVELPMERIVRRNGKVISGESYCYDFYGRITSGYLLETDVLSESLFRLSNKNTAGDFGPTGTAAYRLDSSYKQRATILYDEDDNICQILSPGKRPVCYLWGYNGHYLIAEIRNATYEEIQRKLGSILLNRVRKAVVPSDTDLARINGLRVDKNLLVTTATYRPLYGMISQTDPDGHSKSYEYNSETGRLLQIKDGDGNIETQYSYSQDL